MKAQPNTPQGAPAQSPFAAYNQGKADREAGKPNAALYQDTQAQRDEYAKGYRDGTAPAQLPNTLPQLAALASGMLYIQDDSRTVVRPEYQDVQWLKDLIYAAHENGDRLPSDFTYEVIRGALLTFEDEGCRMRDYCEQRIVEVEADPYTCEILKWLAADLRNAWYVDDAVEQQGFTTLSDALQTAHANWKREIYRSVFDSLLKIVANANGQGYKAPEQEGM